VSDIYDFTDRLETLVSPYGPWVPSGKVGSVEGAPAGIILDTIHSIATCYKTVAGTPAVGSLQLTVDGTDIGEAGIRDIRFDFEFPTDEYPLGGIGLKIEGADQVHSELIALHWWQLGRWLLTDGVTLRRKYNWQDKWRAEPGIHQIRITLEGAPDALSTRVWSIGPDGVPYVNWSRVAARPDGWSAPGFLITIGNLWTQDDAGYFGPREATDLAGSARIRKVSIYSGSEARDDYLDESATLDAVITKYSSLASRVATVDIATHREDLLSKVTESEKATNNGQFTTTCWDATDIASLPGYDPGHSTEKWALLGERFDIAQFLTYEADDTNIPGWNVLIPSSDFVDAGLSLSCRNQWDWNSYIRNALLTHEPTFQVPPDAGITTRQNDAHHPDIIERAVISHLHWFYGFSHWFSGLTPRYLIDTEHYPCLMGVIVKSSATSGTFKLVCNGETTSALDFDATKEEVKDALEALSGITVDEIYVQGSLSDGFYVWSKTKFTEASPFVLSTSNVTLNTAITVSPSAIVQKMAEDYGLTEFHAEWPVYGTDAYPMKWTDTDARWVSILWSYETREMGIMRRLLLDAAQTIWEDIELCTDGVNDTFQTHQSKGMTHVNNWGSCAFAENDPLDNAFYVERARVHIRNNPETVGVILGTQLHSQGESRAIPPDVLTTADWICCGWGASSLTHFGFHTGMWNRATEEWKPNGENVWNTLKTIKDDLLTAGNRALFSSWTPKTRKTAMLCSFADAITGAGETLFVNWSGTDTRPAISHACAYTFHALLYAGEPTDIVYDEDVLDDYLITEGYENLVVPSLHAANQGLIDKIKEFATAGGNVICHDDCILQEEDVTGLQVLSGYYGFDADRFTASLHPKASYTEIISYDGLDAQERREYTLTLAADLHTKLGGSTTIDFTVGDRGKAVGNVMEADGVDYLVLVNTNRQAGDEEAALGGIYSLDEGSSSTVHFTYNGTSYTQDLDTAWGLILSEEITSSSTSISTSSSTSISSSSISTSSISSSSISTSSVSSSSASSESSASSSSSSSVSSSSSSSTSSSISTSSISLGCGSYPDSATISDIV